MTHMDGANGVPLSKHDSVRTVADRGGVDRIVPGG